MIRRIVARQGDARYLILIRTDDVFVDEARLDDMAIRVEKADGYRLAPWPLQRYFKFDAYWEPCEHDEQLLAQLLALPER